MDRTEGARPQRSAPVGIGIVDLKGRMTMADDVLLSSLGYSGEEFAGMPLTAFIHPDDLAAGHERFAQVVDGAIDRYAVERRFIRKDGGYLWVALTVCLIRDANGDPDHVIAVTQDISDRKRLESDPGAEQRRDRLQVERIPAIVYVAGTGPTGGWLYVSPQIEAILGFSAEEWMADSGLWLRQLHSQDREPAFLRAVIRLAETLHLATICEGIETPRQRSVI